MIRQIVSSSNIRSIGYDNVNLILEIEFNSNSIYQYSNVIPSVYNALMSANSKGTYFNSFIKDFFKCRQIR
jgi:hypothetical protein